MYYSILRNLKKINDFEILPKTTLTKNALTVKVCQEIVKNKMMILL